ncbi:MAG: hypothetical protein R6U62_06230, partial [Bacteroidales bacterium]
IALQANPRIFVSSFPRVVSSWFLFTKSVNLFKANFFFSQLPDPIYRSPFTSSFQLPASSFQLFFFQLRASSYFSSCFELPGV